MSRREDVDNAIWGDPTFEGLAPDAKLLYLWSFTNPLCNMAGLYKVSPQRMQRETGLTPQRWERALTELAAEALVTYERTYLWVRTRVKYLRTRTPNMAKSIIGDLGHLEPADPLRQRFVDEYGGFPWLLEKGADAWIALVTASRSSKPKTEYLGDASPTHHDGSRAGQGQGSSSSTGTSGEQQNHSRKASTPDQDTVPATLPAELADRIQPVLEVLERVYAERGGNQPTVRGVGLALAAYPERDHVALARELEHWALAGGGLNKTRKDWVGVFRTFCDKAPTGRPPLRVVGDRPRRFASERTDFSHYDKEAQ